MSLLGFPLAYLSYGEIFNPLLCTLSALTPELRARNADPRHAMSGNRKDVSALHPAAREQADKYKLYWPGQARPD